MAAGFQVLDFELLGLSDIKLWTTREPEDVYKRQGASAGPFGGGKPLKKGKAVLG